MKLPAPPKLQWSNCPKGHTRTMDNRKEISLMPNSELFTHLVSCVESGKTVNIEGFLFKIGHVQIVFDPSHGLNNPIITAEFHLPKITYACGYYDDGAYGMFGGPYDTLEEALDDRPPRAYNDEEKPAHLLKFIEDEHEVLYIWQDRKWTLNKKGDTLD